MRAMTKRNTFFDLESLLTTGELCARSNCKPFKAREALAHVQKIGRPLTEEEMKQFEI